MRYRRIKNTLLIISYLSSFLFLFNFENLFNQPSNEYPLSFINDIESFSGTVTEFKLAHSSEVSEYMSEKKFRSMRKTFQEAFDVELLPVFHPSQHNVIEYYGEKRFSDSTKVQVKWVAKEMNALKFPGKYTGYLLINISGSKRDDFQNEWVFLTRTLQTMNINPSLNFSIAIELNQLMSQTKQTKYLEDTFQSLEGNILNRYKDNSQMIYDGYTNEISSYVIANDKKTNLQLSTQTDMANKKTVVNIGSPLLILE